MSVLSMEDLTALVGRNVRRMRLAAGVSQEELAHRTGRDRTYISDIERGRGNPSVRWLADVATALAIRPVLLFVSERQAALIEDILQTDPGSSSL